MVHSDTDRREKTGGYVLRTVGQAVTQGWGQKYISGCQSCFILGCDEFHEQEKRSRLLTVSTLRNSCVGNDDFNYLWHILFTFGLEGNGVDGAK